MTDSTEMTDATIQPNSRAAIDLFTRPRVNSQHSALHDRDDIIQLLIRMSILGIARQGHVHPEGVAITRTRLSNVTRGQGPTLNHPTLRPGIEVRQCRGTHGRVALLNWLRRIFQRRRTRGRTRGGWPLHEIEVQSLL